MMVLEETQLARLGSAFDRAWDRFLMTGMVTPENLAETRELLAQRIILAAQHGEADEWRLARQALFRLWVEKYGEVLPLPVVGTRRVGKVGIRGCRTAGAWQRTAPCTKSQPPLGSVRLRHGFSRGRGGESRRAVSFQVYRRHGCWIFDIGTAPSSVRFRQGAPGGVPAKVANSQDGAQAASI
jgi:hypothetical protein